jgi:hypothetical protein
MQNLDVHILIIARYARQGPVPMPIRNNTALDFAPPVSVGHARVPFGHMRAKSGGKVHLPEPVIGARQERPGTQPSPRLYPQTSTSTAHQFPTKLTVSSIRE